MSRVSRVYIMKMTLTLEPKAKKHHPLSQGCLDEGMLPFHIVCSCFITYWPLYEFLRVAITKYHKQHHLEHLGHSVSVLEARGSNPGISRAMVLWRHQGRVDFRPVSQLLVPPDMPWLVGGGILCLCISSLCACLCHVTWPSFFRSTPVMLDDILTNYLCSTLFQIRSCWGPKWWQL